FFFSSRRRHTRSKRDWSSDVCSSDLDAHFNIIRYDECIRQTFDLLKSLIFSADLKYKFIIYKEICLGMRMDIGNVMHLVQKECFAQGAYICISIGKKGSTLGVFEINFLAL